MRGRWSRGTTIGQPPRRICVSGRSGWSPRCGRIARRTGRRSTQWRRSWISGRRRRCVSGSATPKVDSGTRPGVTSEEPVRVRALTAPPITHEQLREAAQGLAAPPLRLHGGGRRMSPEQHSGSSPKPESAPDAANVEPRMAELQQQVANPITELDQARAHAMRWIARGYRLGRLDCRQQKRQR
jgi:hypothetical protein